MIRSIHVVAAHIEFLAHIGERLLIAFQRGEPRRAARMKQGCEVLWL